MPSVPLVTKTTFLSFSDLTISNLDVAFNLLRNGWTPNRLDRKQSSSVLFLDDKCCVCRVIDLPLSTKTETPEDAKKLVALAARENAHSILLAQNQRHGIVVPDSSNLRFVSHISQAAKEGGLTLFDYFLINRIGYYSYMEDEYRICPSPYAFLYE